MGEDVRLTEVLKNFNESKSTSKDSAYLYTVISRMYPKLASAIYKHRVQLEVMAYTKEVEKLGDKPTTLRIVYPLQRVKNMLSTRLGLPDQFVIRSGNQSLVFRVEHILRG